MNITSRSSETAYVIAELKRYAFKKIKMKLRYLIILFCSPLVLSTGISVAANEENIYGYSQYKFNEAFKGMLLVELPLEVAFPSDFEFTVSNERNWIWTDRESVEYVKQTGNTPDKPFFWARLTPNAGYDSNTDIFYCGYKCNLEEKLNETGGLVKESSVEKNKINGVPLLFAKVKMVNPTTNEKGIVRMVYIGTLISPNLVLISIRSTQETEKEVEEMWKIFKQTITNNA